MAANDFRTHRTEKAVLGCKLCKAIFKKFDKSPLIDRLTDRQYRHYNVNSTIIERAYKSRNKSKRKQSGGYNAHSNDSVAQDFFNLAAQFATAFSEPDLEAITANETIIIPDSAERVASQEMIDNLVSKSKTAAYRGNHKLADHLLKEASRRQRARNAATV